MMRVASPHSVPRVRGQTKTAAALLPRRLLRTARVRQPRWSIGTNFRFSGPV
jgi:hypothetical protein